MVELTASLVLALSKLAVLGDDLLALVSAPYLIVKLLLLVTLVLDKLDNHRFALLKLKLLHELLLLTYQSSSALFSLLSGRLGECFLGALFESC